MQLSPRGHRARSGVSRVPGAQGPRPWATLLQGLRRALPRRSRLAALALVLGLGSLSGGCSKENQVSVSTGNGCAVDTDCADDGEACTLERCVEGLCRADPAPDEAACPEGQCRAGRCCAGCWDAVAGECLSGLADARACGTGGERCDACTTSAACQVASGTCQAGQCRFSAAADGERCEAAGTAGSCLGGSCCTGCVDPEGDCSAGTCRPTCRALSVDQWPERCGADGRACATCLDDGRPCTYVDCVQGSCTAQPLDGNHGDCVACVAGVCVAGGEGQPCALATPACGVGLACRGALCVRCGGHLEPCCDGAGAPTCAGSNSCTDDLCCSRTPLERLTDPEHCGACGHRCEDQLQNARSFHCAAGQCVLDQCDTDFFDRDGDPTNGCEPCALPLLACFGRCVDPRTDALNCGSCRNACAAPQACAGGSCSCLAPMRECGGVCDDVALDPAHCGACDQPCAETAACNEGVCAPLPRLVVDTAALGITGGLGAVVTDGTELFFGAYDRLYRQPLAGGAPTPIVSLSMEYVTMLSAVGGRVYWVTPSGDGTTGYVTLGSAAYDGTARVDHDTSASSAAIARYQIVGGSLYWLRKDGQFTRRQLMTANLDGTGKRSLVAEATDFAVCGDALLYADNATNLWFRRLTDTTPTSVPFASSFIVGATPEACWFVEGSSGQHALYRVLMASGAVELVRPGNAFPPIRPEFSHGTPSALDGRRYTFRSELPGAGGATQTVYFALDLDTLAVTGLARQPPSSNRTDLPYGSFGGTFLFIGGPADDRIWATP